MNLQKHLWIESFNFLVLLIHSIEIPITLFIKGAVEK